MKIPDEKNKPFALSAKSYSSCLFFITFTKQLDS